MSTHAKKDWIKTDRKETLREIREEERKVDQQRRGIAGTGVQAHDLWTQRGRFKEGFVELEGGLTSHGFSDFPF